ncbi:MAG: uracil-DNA glycosylase [Rhodospirillales bacterium]
MTDKLKKTSEPSANCMLCPRLSKYRSENKEKYPEYFNAPVPSFGDSSAELIIVGLAPGLKGANWSGRPFTGDYAGDLLYATLAKFGFTQGEYGARADDGLSLNKIRITNAVRCAPPQNKVVAHEINACAPYLDADLKSLSKLKAILALGTVAHGALLKVLKLRKKDYLFGHNVRHELPNGVILFDSYHCSRYNTNTGRLTERMFQDVFRNIQKKLSH